MSTGSTPTPTWVGDTGQNNGIKDMFTAIDIAHMKKAYTDKKIPAPILLDDYDNVKRNAVLILGMVKNKRMPPGDPWPDEMVARFDAWTDAGCPKA